MQHKADCLFEFFELEVLQTMSNWRWRFEVRVLGFSFFFFFCIFPVAVHKGKKKNLITVLNAQNAMSTKSPMLISTSN